MRILLRLRFVLLGILCGVLASCAHDPASSPPSQVAPRDTILAASRAFSDAYKRNDMVALGQLYTVDAILLSPGREMKGRVPAQNFFTWGPRYRQLEHSLDSSSLEIRGDIAIDVSTWVHTSQTGDEPVAKRTGSYLVVWAREADGAWRIKYDVWYRPTAPAVAPASVKAN